MRKDIAGALRDGAIGNKRRLFPLPDRHGSGENPGIPYWPAIAHSEMNTAISLSRRARIAVALVLTLAVMAAGIGYLAGHAGGASLASARASGVRRGKANGGAAGRRLGSAAALKAGRAAGYARTYHAAYRRAYVRAAKG